LLAKFGRFAKSVPEKQSVRKAFGKNKERVLFQAESKVCAAAQPQKLLGKIL